MTVGSGQKKFRTARTTNQIAGFVTVPSYFIHEFKLLFSYRVFFLDRAISSWLAWIAPCLAWPLPRLAWLALQLSRLTRMARTVTRVARWLAY